MYLLSNILIGHIEDQGGIIRTYKLLPDEAKTYLADSGEKVIPCILKPSVIGRIQSDLGLDLDLTFEYWDFPELVKTFPKPGDIFVLVDIPADSDGELPMTYHLAMVVPKGDVFAFTWNDSLKQRIESEILVSREISWKEAALFLHFSSVYVLFEDVEPIEKELPREATDIQVCGVHPEDVPELPGEGSSFIVVDGSNPNTKYYLLTNHPDMCGSWFV